MFNGDTSNADYRFGPSGENDAYCSFTEIKLKCTDPDGLSFTEQDQSPVLAEIDAGSKCTAIVYWSGMTNR